MLDLGDEGPGLVIFYQCQGYLGHLKLLYGPITLKSYISLQHFGYHMSEIEPLN